MSQASPSAKSRWRIALPRLRGTDCSALLRIDAAASLALCCPVIPTCHGAALDIHAAAHGIATDTPVERHLRRCALDGGHHGEAQVVAGKGGVADQDGLTRCAHGAAYLLIPLLDAQQV